MCDGEQGSEEEGVAAARRDVTDKGSVWRHGMEEQRFAFLWWLPDRQASSERVFFFLAPHGSAIKM
jgi:hypothetical protein